MQIQDYAITQATQLNTCLPPRRHRETPFVGGAWINERPSTGSARALCAAHRKRDDNVRQMSHTTGRCDWLDETRDLLGEQEAGATINRVEHRRKVIYNWHKSF